MSHQAILAPLFVQVAMTFVLLFTLGPVRVGAVRRGEVKVRDIALGQSAWPDRITQLARSHDNQYQLPVLFYVLVGLAIATAKVDGVLVWGAWVFVGSRILHAVIHTTTNFIMHRFYAFVAGALVLAAMWTWFAVRTLEWI